MKILQISDYHYSDKDSVNNLSDEILKEIYSTLENDLANEIDFAFFTGDLVFSGKNGGFESAYKKLLQPLQEKLNIQPENIFLCQGNHDIDRSKVQITISSYFNNQILDNDQINRFIDQNNNDFESSLNPSRGFFNFLCKLPFSNKDKIEPLYTTHVRSLSKFNIGIASINTAWLSKDNSDYGNLLFPTSIIEKIKQELKNTDFRIILFHHPFSWLKEFNQEKIRNEIYSFFNLGFCGHQHQNHLSTHFIQNEGIFINQNPACLTFEDGRPVGVTLIEYDFKNKDEIFITPFNYDKSSHAFISQEKMHSHIPVGEEKAKQNKIRTKIKSKLNVEISNANDLTLDSEDEENSFLKLFSQPSLKTTPKSQMSEDNLNEWFSFKELLQLNQNYLILGHDKSGKTSILKRIQLHFLKKFPTKPFAPFYFDYNELEAKAGSNVDLKREIRDYFEVNASDTDRIIKDYTLVLLIDNYVHDHFITKEITNFINEYNSVKFVICGKENTYNILDGTEIEHKNSKKLFIHDLRRTQIRKFSNRWELTSIAEIDDLLERIVNICKQLELPLNYWTISLLLLIHKKSRFDASKNLFEILELCIEEILNKKSLVLHQKRLSFDIIITLCSDLAYHLLINYRNTNYSTSYTNIFNCVDQAIENNPRISADPKEVLSYLMNVGILKQKNDTSITFRLNGFFEYFLAKYLTQNSEFKEKILSDNTLYLSFKNELELYSGFRRDDVNFLKRIFNKTKSGLKTIEDSYSQIESSIDKILESKITLVQDLKETARKLKDIEPLNNKDKDSIRDDFEPLEIHSDVQKKKLYNSDDINPEIAEKYLNILSRVLKNSVEVKDYELVYSIFDYLVETYMYFSFYLIDHIQENEIGSLGKYEISDREVNILKIVSNFVPVISQVQFYEGVGNHSLIKIIEDKIESLKSDPNNNQYALFMLYFLLFDIDLENQKNRIDEVINLISIGVLKTSIIIKLNYYLAFKAYNKPKLESFIREKIRKAQKNIDKKSNTREFNKDIEAKAKKNIAKRSREK